MSTPGSPTLAEAWLELPGDKTFWIKGRCAIGRQSDNDLVLETRALSRHHALITLDPNGYTITDLHSSNGTYLNKDLVTKPTLLSDGDEIQIGDLPLRFRCTRQLEIKDDDEGVATTTQKIDKVRPRNCWLLVTDIVGFAPLNEKLGSEAALRRLQEWINDARPLIEKNGGNINGYLGDAIFAFCPCDQPGSVQQVITALKAIEAYRERSPLPFRVVVHQGFVLFTKSAKGEELTGQDVNFVFRSEKIAKKFSTHGMLSEPAVKTLGLESRCDALGTSSVDGMTGTFTFYGMPRDLLT